jgi:hypothetical protein
VTTNKCGRLVQFESEQERKLILLLERDVTVVDFMSQPETLTFVTDDGRTRQYTPDFQVWRKNGQIELHEVTIEQRQEKQSSQQRETGAREVCQQRGWTYHVHTDKTLPTGYEYANLDVLAPFRASIYAHGGLASWWLAQLRGYGQIHPQTILRQATTLDTGSQRLNTLYHLLWHNQVQMDWNTPFLWRGAFHPNTRIWLATQTAYCRETSGEVGR